MDDDLAFLSALWSSPGCSPWSPVASCTTWSSAIEPETADDRIRDVRRPPPTSSSCQDSDGPRRDFRITVGLREGWDEEGRVYDVSEAVRTARAWMRRRVAAGQPALSGMFGRAEVTYAWKQPDGSVGSDREPVATFTGEAVHAYLGHLADAEIEAMLNELATELGAALGQERIYVAFCDRTWILDAEGRFRSSAPPAAAP